MIKLSIVLNLPAKQDYNINNKQETIDKCIKFITYAYTH